MMSTRCMDDRIHSLLHGKKKNMQKEASSFSFEQWVNFAFNHPLPDDGAPNWYHDIDNDSELWNPDEFPEETVDYLTRLFENATNVLAPFSDAQVNQGFWFLVDAACS